ncbi:MAG: response regulator [Sandaracinaceae bacterium]|nr:response regulator [Sandaracinaceae bacterium]MBK8592523.1 response regulator [Sandaracinaceae bacterium]
MTARRRRCAVVDDSRVVLDLLRVVLGDAGWDVSTHSEVGGLELRLREWNPDIILLDVGMPGVGERDLRQRVILLRVATGAKVVLHSAKEPAELEVLGQRAGADGVLAKSGDFAAICATLDRYVPQ